MYDDIAYTFIAITFALVVIISILYAKASKQKDQIEEGLNVCIDLLLGGLITCFIAAIVFKILGGI